MLARQLPPQGGIEAMLPLPSLNYSCMGAATDCRHGHAVLRQDWDPDFE